MNMLVLVFYLYVVDLVTVAIYNCIFTCDLLCYVQFNTSFDWQVNILYQFNVKNYISDFQICGCCLLVDSSHFYFWRRDSESLEPSILSHLIFFMNTLHALMSITVIGLMDLYNTLYVTQVTLYGMQQI